MFGGGEQKARKLAKETWNHVSCCSKGSHGNFPPWNPLPALSSPTAAPAHREDTELPVVPASAVFGVRLLESAIISLVCDLHLLGTCLSLKKAAATWRRWQTWANQWGFWEDPPPSWRTRSALLLPVRLRILRLWQESYLLLRPPQPLRLGTHQDSALTPACES